jgi:hypothetical protein
MRRAGHRKGNSGHSANGIFLKPLVAQKVSFGQLPEFELYTVNMNAL